MSTKQSLLSVLCTKENWTPDDTTTYYCIAFREDGVGCLQLLSDQPGTLLVCEFSWAFETFNPSSATASMIIDPSYTNLEASLHLRQLARFDISIKLHPTAPRPEFGDFGSLDLEDALARRLKPEAFEEKEYYSILLEAGNFAPDHDTNSPSSAAYGTRRWGLRLSFKDGSPIPKLDKWKEEYKLMAESQSWETNTKWFSKSIAGA